MSDELVYMTPSTPRHSADHAAPGFEIDSAEVTRVLDYWRAGGYRTDPTGYDGYAPTSTPDTLNTNDGLHSADYAAPYHVIDAVEAGRVLAYWRAGGYAPDAAGVDGYAPLSDGPQPQGNPEVDALQVVTPQYHPGQTLTVTSTLHYAGQLLSLCWRPNLPDGYEVLSVSGDGNPEVYHGEVLWVFSVPPSPIEMVYTVQVPLSAVGQQDITADVQCFLYGQADPVQAIPEPSVLTVTPADADGDGLPDSWETHYAGPAGLEPDADNDGDGASNIQESVAGTAPGDPSSVFMVNRLVREPDGQIAIHWPSAAGRSYEICSTPSLAFPFVPIASAIPATAPANVWRHTPHTNSTCFYRIQLAN